MTRSRTAAVVTWAYAAMFGLPAVPVAIFLAGQGRLPSLWGLFDMYAGPWSSFAVDRLIALLLVYSGLVMAAVFSAWLLWQRSGAGAVLNLGLLPAEAVFWVGFALPVPWLFAIARVALVALAWPELSGSRHRATAATPGGIGRRGEPRVASQTRTGNPGESTGSDGESERGTDIP